MTRKWIMRALCIPVSYTHLGAFSSPDDVLDREIVRNLFPDTVYANESGGDPDVIPNLTYEQFLDFHRKYYHPANSYICL